MFVLIFSVACKLNHISDTQNETWVHGDIGDLQRIDYDEEHAAGDVKNVLVHDQYELLVLFRCHQSPQHESIGRRAYQSDDYDGTAEVEVSTT